MEIEKPQKGEYVLSVNIDQGPSRILAVQVLEPWEEYSNSFWKLKFFKSNTFLNRYLSILNFLVSRCLWVLAETMTITSVVIKLKFNWRFKADAWCDWDWVDIQTQNTVKLYFQYRYFQILISGLTLWDSLMSVTNFGAENPWS